MCSWLKFCCVKWRPTASNHKHSQLWTGQDSNSDLRGRRQLTMKLLINLHYECLGLMNFNNVVTFIHDHHFILQIFTVFCDLIFPKLLTDS